MSGVLVGCFRPADAGAAYSGGEEVGFARLTVVDPDGLWISPDLACEDPERLGELDVADVTGRPDDEAMARAAVPGLRSTDFLQRPGYPETEVEGRAPERPSRWPGDRPPVVPDSGVLVGLARHRMGQPRKRDRVTSLVSLGTPRDGRF